MTITHGGSFVVFQLICFNIFFKVIEYRLPTSSLHFRITSYNVCYTKLLRVIRIWAELYTASYAVGFYEITFTRYNALTAKTQLPPSYNFV